MATQLADTYEEPQGGDDGADDTPQGGGERDFDAEARAHGWVPKEEFKGDPSRWVDAETFVKKADTAMPLLRKRVEAQDREIRDLKKQMSRASEFFSKAEERAYERALADLKKQQVAAVEAGDVEAFRAVDKQIEDLRKDVADHKPAAQPSETEVREALIEFREQNPWYDEGGIARDYADLLADKHKDKAQSMAPAEFFAFIADEVKKRYPGAGSPDAGTKKRGSPVEGGSSVRRGNGRTFADLPPEAQRMADKWVKTGLIKSRDDYLKSYQWEK